MNVGQLLQSGLDQATRYFSAYLITLGVISALTMAFLQALKDMTRVRESYHREKLREWLLERSRSLAARQANAEPDELVRKAEVELVRLATDGDRYAFYGGELQTLCSQFSGAASLVMDYPSLSRDLFELLTVYASREDVHLLLSHKLAAPIPTLAVQHQDPEELKALAEKRHEIIEARNRVRHQVVQSISSFQLSTGARWQRRLKIWSWIVSTSLTALILFLSDKKTDPGQIAFLLFTSVIAGFLAPIARDLMAALQRLRA